MSSIFQSEPHKVLIVYYLFGHYRKAIMTRLMNSPRHHYLFAADIKDRRGSGIELWAPADPKRFIVIPSFFIWGNILIQPGAVRLAFRRDVETIIFAGDAHFLTTWIAAAIARLLGKRVLFWTHGWTRFSSSIKESLRRLFYRLGDGLLVYGQRAKKIAIQKGFKSENVYVVYNSLDYEFQRSIRVRVTSNDVIHLRSELFKEPQHPVLIFVGRLVPTHRVDLLIEAVYQLKLQGHPLNVLIVGDGTERLALETLASERQLPVKFYGPCYKEERLASLFMSANLMVVPGKIGLTAMHSLVYGVPVITHDNPDDQMPEWEAIIPGKNGAFYKQNDVWDLARAIAEWTQTEFLNEQTRTCCYEVIDAFYNPDYQFRVIERAVLGHPALDA